MCESNRNVCVSFLIALGLSLTIFSPVDSSGQKLGKGRYAGRRASLKRDARKNGYTTTMEGTVIYFEANDVEDPTTEELLEDMKKLVFRCRPGDPLSERRLRFSRGRSERLKVQCLFLIKPEVLIADEPESEQ